MRNIDEESVGFHGDPRATGSGGEQTDLRAVLEQLQRMNAQFDHIDQRMDRLKTSQVGVNTRLDAHGDQGRGRGGRGRFREEFREGNFEDDLEEEFDENFALQERQYHGRPARKMMILEISR